MGRVSFVRVVFASAQRKGNNRKWSVGLIKILALAMPCLAITAVAELLLYMELVSLSAVNTYFRKEKHYICKADCVTDIRSRMVVLLKPYSGMVWPSGNSENGKVTQGPLACDKCHSQVSK